MRWFILLGLLLSAVAKAQSASIELERERSKEKRIPGLTFLPAVTQDLEIRTEAGSPITCLVIHGKRALPASSSLMSLDGGLIQLDAQGAFKFVVKIAGKDTAFDLMDIQPDGEIVTEKLTVHIPAFGTSQSLVPVAVKSEFVRFSYSTGLALTLLQYQESSQVKPLLKFQSNLLTLKGSAAYQEPGSRWSYGLAGYLNLFPLSSSLSGVSARFFGLNARAGYEIPFIDDSWKLVIRGGFFYTTMFVSADVPSKAFGYRNVAGPQIFPTLSKRLSSERSLSGYLKFSPVSSSFALMNLASHEFAAGLIYGFQMQGFHPLSVSLDLSQIHLSLPELRGFTADSTSISLGFNYQL